MAEILIHGPICESWYLAAYSEDWLGSHDGRICRHGSCWDIMCLSDGPLGFWFKGSPRIRWCAECHPDCMACTWNAEHGVTLIDMPDGRKLCAAHAEIHNSKQETGGQP